MKDFFSAHVQPDGILQLDNWLPYQCSIVTNRVSTVLKRMYADEFGIGVNEWRLIANLAAHAPLSSKELAEHTAMDQVAVTRAVTLLVKKSLVSRKVDQIDRRKVELRLSKKGFAAYQRVAPLARVIEDELTRGLEPEELAKIRATLEKLVRAANAALGDDVDWRALAAQHAAEPATVASKSTVAQPSVQRRRAPSKLSSN